MKNPQRPIIVIFVALLALGVAGLGVWVLKTPREHTLVQVKEPALSARAQTGKAAFDANCARCHGVNASGTDKGPPLVHDIYNPGHHGDASFRLAPKRGVRAHHWPFGDMPPLPEVTELDMTAIIAYVRELQRANGIVARPHRMNMSQGLKN